MEQNSYRLPEFKLSEFPYRVWAIHNPPNCGTFIPVKTIQEAINLIELLSMADLERDEVNCNAFGLLHLANVTDDGKTWYQDWEEWYDEEGNSIMDIINNP